VSVCIWLLDRANLFPLSPFPIPHPRPHRSACSYFSIFHVGPSIFLSERFAFHLSGVPVLVLYLCVLSDLFSTSVFGLNRYCSSCIEYKHIPNIPIPEHEITTFGPIGLQTGDASPHLHISTTTMRRAMSGSAFRLAVGALILLSFLSARADPIDKANYHLVGVGNCRGNGGTADKIDSKIKRLAVQKDCEAECDKLANCVSYTFNVGAEYCAIYGAGMDGQCSITDKNVNEECGTCSVAKTKKTKDTCGDCSVKPPSGWAETENFCKSSSDAVWTAGVWTAGLWTDAAGDWEGDSQHTTHIHATDHIHATEAPASTQRRRQRWRHIHATEPRNGGASAGANCYDKNLHDHQSHCTGAASCQTNFNAKQLNQTGHITCPAGCTYTAGNTATATLLARPPTCDGTAKDPEATPDCTAAGIQGVAADCETANGCIFMEPVKGLSLKTSHDPIIHLDGWQKEKRSWGDTIGKLYPKDTNGACRVEGNGIKPVHSTWCKTCECFASNGMSVGLQEGCAQACLDTPSGTCVGYAHSSKYCVLYTGLHINTGAGHPGTGPDTPNVWAKNEQPVVPCLSYDNPPSCKTPDVAKPNPQYICILLEVGPKRWKAFGPPGDRYRCKNLLCIHICLTYLDTSLTHTIHGREDISIRMAASKSVSDYTDSIKVALRQKMAALSFVNKTATDAADVTLQVIFALTVNECSDVPDGLKVESCFKFGEASTWHLV